MARPRKVEFSRGRGKHSHGKWWAWVDLNHRPRPYQGSVVRFYNNLQDRQHCQNTRKSYKTSHVVGWIVGWKIAGERSGILLFATATFRIGPTTRALRGCCDLLARAKMTADEGIGFARFAQVRNSDSARASARLRRRLSPYVCGSRPPDRGRSFQG